MRFLFVHLLNNFTGSPRVLSNFLSSFSENHKEIDLLTSNTEGCLSGLNGIKYHKNFYCWKSNKFVLIILFLLSQVYQFFFVLFSKKYECVYINTIMPFGAALAARIKRERIIYHVHEYYPHANILQRFCVKIAFRCADQVIYVSKYLESCYKNCPVKKSSVIYNTVSFDFKNNAEKIILGNNYFENKYSNKEIVLPCSLKEYKGIYLFLELAKKMPGFKFLLVTSNSKAESDILFQKIDLPSNVSILNEVSDMISVYSKASVVLNLSLTKGRNQFIETFGMVLIEALELGTPCIAPNVGGPLEIIENGKNGFSLEVEKLEEVIEKIYFIMDSFENYNKFCENAIERVRIFSPEIFTESIESVICNE